MAHQVDVIIPHYKGREKLLNCLESLFRTEYDDFKVILVDNGCVDESCDEAKKLFPEIEILKLEKNLGFAGGCNAGVRSGSGEFAALLNDDTEVQPDWLRRLVDAMVADEKVAAAQPKMRWILDKSKFDYAGAAGGMMDIFGFPFCYGRMFETIETDEGQYDWVREIFWASGSATLYRRKLFLEAGGLDERFFAHQEEIDLNWRYQLMGWKIIAVPQAVVYHYAGATLPAAGFKKKYLNHRNSIMMLVKNYRLRTLFLLLPLRLALEGCAMALAVKQGDFKRILAIIGAIGWNIYHLPILMLSKERANKLRRIGDREIMSRMYKGSVALQYYLFSKKNYFQLVGNAGKAGKR